MPKRPPTQYYYDANEQQLTNELKYYYKDFVKVKTSYSCKYLLEKKTILVSKSKPSQSGFFILAAMIKKDFDAGGFHIDDIPRNEIKYFKSNQFKILKGAGERIALIDIKSAYLTVLHNAGMICDKTFNFGNTINKEDRLKGVGMLATNKTTFNYMDGECVSFFKDEPPRHANVFFYACYTVGIIMNEISAALGNDFFYFWVDGIYFKNTFGNIKKVVLILKRYNYKYSYENITQFNCELKNNYGTEYITIKYLGKKKGKSADGLKIFNIPI